MWVSGRGNPSNNEHNWRGPLRVTNVCAKGVVFILRGSGRGLGMYGKTHQKPIPWKSMVGRCIPYWNGHFRGHVSFQGCSEKMVGTFVFYRKNDHKRTRHGPTCHVGGGSKIQKAQGRPKNVYLDFLGLKLSRTPEFGRLPPFGWTENLVFHLQKVGFLWSDYWFWETCPRWNWHSTRKEGFPKRNIVSQPAFFRDYVSFWGE